MNEAKKIYTQEEIAEILFVEEKELTYLVKQFHYGTKIKGTLVYTEDEAREIIDLFNAEYEIRKRRIVSIINEYQPVTIGKVRRIYRKEYTAITKSTVESIINKLSVDDIDPNLWEDDDGNMWYGTERFDENKG